MASLGPAVNGGVALRLVFTFFFSMEFKPP
jgi:hypothetical protein